MDAKFECPHCRQHLAVPPELLGTLVECPACNGQIQLTQQAPVASPPPWPSVPQAPVAPPEPSAANIDRQALQKLANRRFLHKALALRGLGSVVFGLIGIGIGWWALEKNSANAVLVGIGIFLVAEGLWAIVAPRRFVMILDGIAFFLIGAWNLYLVGAEASGGGGGGSGGLGLLAIWQFVWGFQSFGHYRRFAALPMDAPSRAAFQQIDALVKPMLAAKVAEHPDMVEFQTKVYGNNQVWRGKLARNFATFADASGAEVVFVACGDVGVVVQGTAKAGKPVEAFLQLGDRRFTVRILPEHLERLAVWAAERLDGAEGANVASPPIVVPKASIYATCSLGFALAALLLSAFGLGILSVPAIICGHAGRAKIRKFKGALTGGGMCLASLIVGYLELAFWLLRIFKP